jgi:hypothetical protein
MKSARMMMIGSGIPINQSSAPRPKPMVTSLFWRVITATTLRELIGSIDRESKNAVKVHGCTRARSSNSIIPTTKTERRHPDHEDRTAANVSARMNSVMYESQFFYHRSRQDEGIGVRLAHRAIEAIERCAQRKPGIDQLLHIESPIGVKIDPGLEVAALFSTLKGTTNA